MKRNLIQRGPIQVRGVLATIFEKFKYPFIGLLVLGFEPLVLVEGIWETAPNHYTTNPKPLVGRKQIVLAQVAGQASCRSCGDTDQPGWADELGIFLGIKKQEPPNGFSLGFSLNSPK